MNTINLPNLYDEANISQPIILGDKTYMFNFRWIADFCSLDILLNDTYVVKGKAIVLGSDLISRVKDDNIIKGSLYLVHKYGLQIEPTQETFATDYYLVWGE